MLMAAHFVIASPASAILLNDDFFTSSGGSLTNADATALAGYQVSRSLSLQDRFLSVGDLGNCTATWLGYDATADKSYLLTAAHCVEEDFEVTSRTVNVTFRDYGGTLQYDGAATAHIPPERYDGTFPENGSDLALLEVPGQITIYGLDDSIVPPPLISVEERTRLGEVVEHVGYGLWGTKSLGERSSMTPTNFSERRAYGSNTIHELVARANTTRFDEPGDLGYQEREARLAPGDSGSAWWGNYSGTPAITEVSSSLAGDVVSVGTSVGAYSDWIESIFGGVATFGKTINTAPATSGGAFFSSPSLWAGGVVPGPNDRVEMLDFESPEGVFPGLVLWGGDSETVYSLNIAEDSDAEFVTCCGNEKQTLNVREDAALRTGSRLRLGRANEGLDLAVGGTFTLAGALELRDSNVEVGVLYANGSLEVKAGFNRVDFGDDVVSVPNAFDRSFGGTITQSNGAGVRLSKDGKGLQRFRFADLDVDSFIIRDGVVEVTGGTLKTSGSAAIVVGTGDNSARLDIDFRASVETGVLNIASGQQSTGTVTLEGAPPNDFGPAEVVVEVADAVWIGFANGSPSGNGTLIVKDYARLTASGSGISIGPEGRLDLDGGLVATRSFDNANGGTFSHTDGELVVDGGAFAVSDTDFRVNSSSSTGVPILTLRGSTSNSTLPNRFVVGSQAGATLNIEDGATLHAPGTIFLAAGGGNGDANVTGMGSTLSAGNDLRIGQEATSTLTVGAGASATAAANILLGRFPGSDGTAIVDGSLQAGGKIEVGYMDAGLIEVRNDGEVTAGGAINIGSAGELDIRDGAVTSSSFTIAAGGVLSINSGTLTVEGDYRQESAGRLSIELSAPTAGNEGFDALAITDTADLSGELEVAAIGGFTTSVGESVEILTASSVVSGFDSVVLPELAGNIEFHVVYSSDAVTLVVAPVLQGDFNADGTVDAADYAVWRDNFDSTTNLAADANLDLVVDDADYDIWVSNFGAMLPSSAASVPEPAAAGLLLVLAVVATASRQRQS